MASLGRLSKVSKDYIGIIKNDPCSYCGRSKKAITVDHILPRASLIKGTMGRKSWINFTGACEACNTQKGNKRLLMFLLTCKVSLDSRRRSEYV